MTRTGSGEAASSLVLAPSPIVARGLQTDSPADAVIIGLLVVAYVLDSPRQMLGH